jgi:membrane-bound ClpP family serine protease
MSPILAIVLLILVGLLLLLLEVLVIPGTTVAGVIGFILLGGGIWMAFDTFGTNAGIIAIASTLVATGLVFFLAFRSGTWKKLMLKENIESKVDSFEGFIPKVGDVGIAISRLAPMGKVIINNHEYEARSQNSYIDEKSTVEVIIVESNKIIVKLKS